MPTDMPAVSEMQGAAGCDIQESRPRSVGPVPFVRHFGRSRLDVCHVCACRSSNGQTKYDAGNI